ncbi:potassium channel family protein [Vibrio parahaemolyticus]|uniref:potassium channel family protein n=1 Tax=Vibrio parahaemolyticus TaxID=670 RepID=UPI001E4B9B86|nr:potassium channel family protein [Vibrio parahaemolyticus]EID7698981.1 hypothetical protein [Vibrio parahaemolyticus]EJG1424714.1 hypothetical protein [Vibrio parahaemolyticus]MDG2845361.1 potassium channel family protein [Vibrio parahaemolyticus]HCE3307269.1 hypothetical protein [Vibrio parahaemolyticus]
MDILDYLEGFSNELKETLLSNKSNRVNGLQKLLEYILDLQQSGELDSSYDDTEKEEFEEIIYDNKKLIIDWFKEKNHSWLDIISDNSWALILDVEKQESDKSKESFILSEEQMELINKNSSLITREDTRKLIAIYNKLSTSDNQELKAKCARLIAEGRFEQGINIGNAIEWNRAGDDYSSVNQSIASECYENAADIYAKESKYSKSASCYQKSISIIEKEDERDNERYIRLIRDCRIQYEHAGLNSDAAKMFVKECDIVAQESKTAKKWLMRIFKATANYGESPIRVVITALIVILTSATFYSLFGVYPSGENVPIHNFFTSLYFSLVTFTTLGYGDILPQGCMRVVATIQALLGLILTSLFMVTLVRKYSR